MTTALPGRALRPPVVPAVLAAAVLGACSGPSAYDRTLAEWTRKVETYEDFESRVFVRATLKSEPFRREYARRYADLFALSPEQAEALAAAETDEAAREVVLVLAFFATKQDWDDLDPRRGLWNLTLAGPSGDRVGPAGVRRLRAEDPAWERLYPYLEHHDSLWEVRFPRLSEVGEPLFRAGDDVTFLLAGAPARVELGWTLE